MKTIGSCFRRVSHSVYMYIFFVWILNLSMARRRHATLALTLIDGGFFYCIEAQLGECMQEKPWGIFWYRSDNQSARGKMPWLDNQPGCRLREHTPTYNGTYVREGFIQYIYLVRPRTSRLIQPCPSGRCIHICPRLGVMTAHSAWRTFYA